MKTHITKFIFIVFIFIGSCNKDESNDTLGNSDAITINVIGQISGETGLPLVNVKVSIGNKTSMTDANGIYTLTKVLVPRARAVVRASFSGYWEGSKGFIPNTSGINYCNFSMSRKLVVYNLSGSVGGTVNLNGAIVIFPANAFVNGIGTAHTGNVKIALKLLPTTNTYFSSLIPGGDLLAINSAGQERVLISFGMLGVELYDNNNNSLALAPGVKATIQIPIEITQQASAASTIPLWYFDESAYLWKEEGFATRQGNNYIGEVSHFTWWNYDQSEPGVLIKGKVVDCNGTPMPNARVYSSNSAGPGIYTDSNGAYSGFVVAGNPHSIQASVVGFGVSQTETSPPLSIGQVYTYPDLIIPCPNSGILNLTILDCNSLPINNTVVLSNGSNLYFFNTNAGQTNMNVPCGFYFINTTATGVNNYDSVYVDCIVDSTFKTIVLCPTTQTTSPLGLSVQLNIINFNYFDPNAFANFVAPNIPAMSVNNLMIAMPTPAIAFDMTGVPYIPGLTLLSPPAAVYIGVIVNGIQYEITPKVGAGYNFYIDHIQTGQPNDTVEINMYGDITLHELNTGIVQTWILNSFRAKFIRPL